MSIEALRWAKNARTGNHTTKLVLLMLADCHSEVQNVAWPGVMWLAEHCEMSRRTVQRALRDLEAQGLIEWDGTWAGKHVDRQTKRYRFPSLETGRQDDTGRHTVQTGRHTVTTGRHSDARTLIEPTVTTTPPTPPSRRRKTQAERVLDAITNGAAQ